MREAIGSTWIYQLVIVFILIFVSFLILALTYSKSFKTKNEMIDIIEKYEGVTADSVLIMNNYLKYSGYKTMGKCPQDGKVWLASANLENNTLVKANSNTKYYYCIRRQVSGKPSNGSNVLVSSTKYFYEVNLFFKFNLPFIGSLSTFTVDGVTGDVYKNKSDLFNKVK